MKQKVITKVIKVNDIIKNKMIDFYEGKKRSKTPPYAIFQADENDTVITLYESGKAMFQGVSADVEASMWEMINKSGSNLDDFFEEKVTNKNSNNKEIELPLEINSIGSDEVGTGDYFGPIVVTASYVSKENIPFLTELGVRDSKKLSDERIIEIVPKIIKKIPYKTIILNNKDYNNHYGKDMNMNKIKAILHNKALYNLVNDNHQYDYIVVDQFESPKSYFNHLNNTNNVIKDITFITKAEDKCLSVACSSLISRYVFIKEIDKLSDKYGVFIPKGASSYVDDIAIKLVNKYGDSILKDIAKLNFSNTERVMKFKD